MPKPIPSELERIREAAKRALGPVCPVSDSTSADKDFLFTAQRSEASRDLPPYYLIYFVLVDLLGFKNLGQFEKISWSVPIDYKGRAFLIEHRKFGVGVFVRNSETDEADAREIVKHLTKAIKAAEPYFNWLADEALQSSTLNVMNNSAALLHRFTFFQREYERKVQEVERRKDETIVTKGNGWQSYKRPAFELQVEARWLALAAIESFFSWTEHVFILITILRGKVARGLDIAQLSKADWPTKFKAAFDLADDPASKVFYDRLIEIKTAIRNFVAHGAFGKNGEAFEFHSGAGSVPLMLPHRASKLTVKMADRLIFDDASALKTLESFIPHLWSGPRAPAELYIQQSQLPIILTSVSDGTYLRAMQSIDEMTAFVDHLSRQFDRAANMDW